jgi:hypothetical protein
MLVTNEDEKGGNTAVNNLIRLAKSHLIHLDIKN